MHILTEWQIKDWIRDATASKADKHEVFTLDSTMDRLASSLREARAEIDGLRRRCEQMETQVQTLTQPEGA